jgi:hypothetical protein
MQKPRKHIEIYTTGCHLSAPAVEIVVTVARHCDVTIYNVREDERAAQRARDLSIVMLPTVLVDGVKLPGDWRGQVSAAALRAAGVD